MTRLYLADIEIRLPFPLRLTCALFQQQIDDIEPAIHRCCVECGLPIKVRHVHVTGPSYQSFKGPWVPSVGSACHQLSQLTLTKGPSTCFQVLGSPMVGIHDGIWRNTPKWTQSRHCVASRRSRRFLIGIPLCEEKILCQIWIRCKMLLHGMKFYNWYSFSYLRAKLKGMLASENCNISGWQKAVSLKHFECSSPRRTKSISGAPASLCGAPYPC